MVVRNEIRADIAEAIDALKDRIGHMESTLETVQNQTANLNGRLVALESDATRNVNRANRAAAELAQLKHRLAALTVSEARPEIHDPARRRISFIGFAESLTIASRICSMDAFMRQHFPEMKPVGVNLLASNDGRPSKHGFVECGSPQQARTILELIKKRNLHIAAHADVQIKQALTDIDRNGNLAIHAAEHKI